MSKNPASTRARSENGAVLVLALVFLLAMGLVAVATAGLAVGAGANTSNTRALALSQANVESEVSLAISNVRYKYDLPPGCTGDNCYWAQPTVSPYFSTPVSCTPPTSEGGLSGLQVACDGQGGPSFGTRTVQFYVCSTSISVNTCAASSGANYVLYAEVTFQDLPIGEAPSDNQCASSFSPPVCGITTTIDAWDVRLADS